MTDGVAFARAGLLGNPSDGYGGKIIAISVKNYAARVVLEESDVLRFVASAEDGETFSSMDDFERHADRYGYDGGIRLIKAGLKTFLGYGRGRGVGLPTRPFAVRYESTIPRQVGLGGSSAIITAAMRAFSAFYGVEIPLEIQPELVLDAERAELAIVAGFMDRVAQVYEGCVYMDLDPDLFRTNGHGRYERLDPGLLPPLYLAFRPESAKVSGRVLSEIRTRFDAGDDHTTRTLRRIADLAERGRTALLAGRPGEMASLMNENFDLRRTIMAIRPADLAMIEAVRACGASAKFAGSGGSVVGSYRDERMFGQVVRALESQGAVVVKPVIA
jgi:glucuronokinase